MAGVRCHPRPALLPTDTPDLARWVKVLKMLQPVVSLTVLDLLAARAVNIP